MKIRHYKILVISFFCGAVLSLITQLVFYPQKTEDIRLPFTLMFSLMGLSALTNVMCGIQHHKLWNNGFLNSYEERKFDYFFAMSIYTILGVMFLLGAFKNLDT
jgi:hypothetical protein